MKKETTKKAPAKAKEPAKTRNGKKIGRPSDYTDEKAALICEELATGMSIRQICAAHPDTLPDKSTIFRWMYRYPSFRDQYLHAKHLGMIAYGEDSIDIADDGSNDWIEKLDKDGNPTGQRIFDHEHVNRSRLRVDTRKWFMERLAPKNFGSKVDVNHGVQEDNPIMSLLSQVSGSTLRPTEEPDDTEQHNTTPEKHP